MTVRFAFAASLLALAACQPQATEPAAAPPASSATPVTTAASGCDVSVQAAWLKADAALGPHTAEARVFGPTCQNGVVTLVVRQNDGAPVYAWSGVTAFLFGLKDATDPAAMKTALGEWIGIGAAPATTATLPPWEQTEGQSQRAEFPFMPDEGFDKAAWDALRAEAAPLFCFPQGLESMRCAALRGPVGMEEIGLQLFPG